MKAWFTHHAHSLRLALQRLGDTPLASLFSILVIGVALSLPAGLYLLLQNLHQVAGHVPVQAELTLYLKKNIDEAGGKRLANQLRERPDVESARFISRDEGLKTLEAGGLGDVLAGLEGNPLPHAITVRLHSVDGAILETLAEELGQRSDVDRISMDSDWAHRLAALMRFGTSVTWLLAGLLGLALAAITGNTIRLQIFALREEIEVSRLIGATDRFIRRPFLYHGALQGLLGGVAAWGLMALAQVLLSGLVDDLAAAYGSRFVLQGLGLEASAIMIGTATGLGLLGAWLAVDHSLRQIDR